MFTTLPTEIHAIIVAFASAAKHLNDERIDHSSVALCLTSRHFLSLAQPILYRTPFLVGRRRVSRFAGTLRRNSRLAKHVVHLAITDVAHPSKELQTERPPSERGDGHNEDSVEILPDFAFAFPATHQGRLNRMQMLTHWMEARAKAIGEFRVSFLEILEGTCSRLQSLTILFYSIYHDRSSNHGLANGLSLSYPRLTELTIREDFLSLAWPAFDMPCLRELLVAGGNPPYPKGLLLASAAGCPELARIRLSEPFVDEQVALALKSILLGASCASASATTTRPGTAGSEPVTLGSARQIVLQPCLLRTTGPTSMDIMRCLREVEAGVENFKVKESSDRSSDRYPFAEAANDWSNRMLG